MKKRIWNCEWDIENAIKRGDQWKVGERKAHLEKWKRELEKLEEKIKRLKELENELELLDTNGFEQEVNSIREKLSMDNISEVEEEIEELRVKIEEEEKRKEEERKREREKNIWENIDYLYCIEPIDNMSSILEHGLLSHNRIHELGISHKDISDEKVQNLRAKKNDPIHNRPLHDYACLYFKPRNPMLCALKHIQQDIVILGFDKQLLCEPETIFTDGNAAAYNTQFYIGIENLDKLDWEIINARYWTDEEYISNPRKKRIKCAEILLYQKIPIERIQKIFCYSKEQCSKVYETIPDNISIQIEINNNLYF